MFAKRLVSVLKMSKTQWGGCVGWGSSKLITVSITPVKSGCSPKSIIRRFWVPHTGYSWEARWELTESKHKIIEYMEPNTL